MRGRACPRNKGRTGIGEKTGAYWKVRGKELVVGKILGLMYICFFFFCSTFIPFSDSSTQFSFGDSFLPRCQPSAPVWVKLTSYPCLEVVI